jgi:hypothetical protein
MIVEETQKDGQWMGLDRWVAWEMVCQTYLKSLLAFYVLFET